MTVPPYALVIVIVIFGFLTASTIYFYDQSRATTVHQDASKALTFTGQVPSQTTNTAQNQALAQYTKPDAPRARLSYPTNIYAVVANDSLYSISQKFQLSQDLIMQANSLTNPNSLQAGFPLIIPALDNQTDYYRINLTLNDTVATSLNDQYRQQNESDYFDPVKVAKMDGVPYFGVVNTDDFTLGQENLNSGTALVQVKSGGTLIDTIGLYQPKIKGSHGIWAVLYVEQITTAGS